MKNTTSRRLYCISAVLCAFSLVGLVTARAQNDKPASDPSAVPAHLTKAERALLKTKDQLKLSNEQWAKVEPLLAEREKRHKALLKEEREANPRPSLTETDQKNRQLENDIEAKLAPLLSAEQLAQYKVLREQALKRMEAAEQRHEKTTATKASGDDRQM